MLTPPLVSSGGKDERQVLPKRGARAGEEANGWPRSWANFSVLQLYPHMNAWANWHLLGQRKTFLAAAARPAQPQPDAAEAPLGHHRAPHRRHAGPRAHTVDTIRVPILLISV